MAAPDSWVAPSPTDDRREQAAQETVADLRAVVADRDGSAEAVGSIADAWRPGSPHLTANLFKLGGIVLAVSVLAWLVNAPRQGPLNYYLSVVWSLYFPVAVVGVIGAVRSRRFERSTFSGAIDCTVVFVVPTVARADTLPGLYRVVASVLEFAPRNLRDYVLHIVVDEGAEGIPELQFRFAHEPRVEIVVVPADYATPSGAMHKGRANHYAMEFRKGMGLNGDDMFVYHLDDDTGVGPDTIASIAEFIHEDDGTYDLAQGALSFPHQLSASKFAVLADSVRPGDDLTRFQFFTGGLAKPLGGLHGEHLLVRASTEEAVGWDFGPTKVEDAYFAFRFVAERHGRSKFLNSFCYGASPHTLRDLIKQRRRWAGGLIALIFDRSVPVTNKLPLGYAVGVWSSGVFQHVSLVLLIAFATGTPSTSPVMGWLVPVWSFVLGYLVWQYLEGLRVNLQASNLQRRYLPYAVVTVPLVFVFTAVEAWAAVLGLKDVITGNRDFAVISKQR